jgi:hypothetical protein
VHDYPLVQASGWLPQLPEGLRLWVDRGFQGIEHAAPQLVVFQPRKKPRRGSLPKWAPALNGLTAKVRVRRRRMASRCVQHAEHAPSADAAC